MIENRDAESFASKRPFDVAPRGALLFAFTAAQPVRVQVGLARVGFVPRHAHRQSADKEFAESYVVFLRAQEDRRSSGVRRRDNHAVDQQLDVKVRHEVEESRCRDRSIVAGEPLDASGQANERVIADHVQPEREHRDRRRRNRVT